MAEEEEEEFLGGLFDEEAQFYEEGKESGIKEGRERAQKNSYQEGQKKGLEIIGEVKYFQFIAEQLLEFAEASPTLLPKSKAQLLEKHLRKITSLAKEASFEDPKNAQLKEGIEKIQSKYKVCMSLLGIEKTSQGLFQNNTIM